MCTANKKHARTCMYTATTSMRMYVHHYYKLHAHACMCTATTNMRMYVHFYYKL